MERKKKEIICENCGAVYYSDAIPSCLRCTCLCENFKIPGECVEV